MTTRPLRSLSRSRVPWAIGGILAVICAALVAGVLLRSPRPAAIFITADDCRRSFDDARCRAIVEHAQSVHANTAPLFQAREVCNFVFGPDGCETLREANIELNLFAPRIVAIAVTADGAAVMPLYLGPPHDPNADTEKAGRPVYFRKQLVGFLSRPSFGGAQLPVLTGAGGDAITERDLRRLVPG